ncbi:hypothetical protein [Cognatilysobacter segetis]|uniref:hypothetical protein n=1 Tax=Cognatilysobacter segetis TaxID=2492394 RepID=UPI00105F3F19|nr:hypothetical protein [Lysobacter segetis]
MIPRRAVLATRFLALVSFCVVAAGCSEKMDQPAPQTSSANPASAPKVLPAGAQFEAAQETVDAITQSLNSGVCSVENVVTVPENQSSPGAKPNSYVATRDKSYRVVGFAVNKDAGTVPAKVDIVLSGIKSYRLPVETGRPRQDVADFFKTPAFDKSGYMADVAFSNVDPGDYAIYFVDNGTDKKVSCATNQSISIR